MIKFQCNQNYVIVSFVLVNIIVCATCFDSGYRLGHTTENNMKMWSTTTYTTQQIDYSYVVVVCCCCFFFHWNGLRLSAFHQINVSLLKTHFMYYTCWLIFHSCKWNNKTLIDTIFSYKKFQMLKLLLLIRAIWASFLRANFSFSFTKIIKFNETHLG